MKNLIISSLVGITISINCQAQFGKKFLQSVKDAANKASEPQENTSNSENSTATVERTNLSANTVLNCHVQPTKIDPIILPNAGFSIIKKGMLQNKIEVLDNSTGQTVQRYEDFKALFANPILNNDNKLLAVGLFKQLKVIDIVANTAIDIPMESLTKGAYAFYFTLDSKKLILIDFDKRFHLIDIASKSIASSNSQSKFSPNSVQFSADNNSFYIGLEADKKSLKETKKCDNILKVSLLDGSVMSKINGGHSKDVTNLCLNKNYLFAADAAGFVSVWNTNDNTMLFTTDDKFGEEMLLDISLGKTALTKMEFNPKLNMLFTFKLNTNVDVYGFGAEYATDKFKTVGLKLLDSQFPPIGTQAYIITNGFESTSKHSDLFFNFISKQNTFMMFKEWFKKSPNLSDLARLISKSYTDTEKDFVYILLDAYMSANSGDIARSKTLIALAKKYATNDYLKSMLSYCIACISLKGSQKDVDTFTAKDELKKSYSAYKWNKEFIAKDSDFSLITDQFDYKEIIK